MKQINNVISANLIVIVMNRLGSALLSPIITLLDVLFFKLKERYELETLTRRAIFSTQALNKYTSIGYEDTAFLLMTEVYHNVARFCF